MNSSRKNQSMMFVAVGAGSSSSHIDEGGTGGVSSRSYGVSDADARHEMSTFSSEVGEEATAMPSTWAEDYRESTDGLGYFSIADRAIPFPRIPEGISEEDGNSLGALATVVLAYHQMVPEAVQGEYVRQLMKFAGEKAGQLIRMCSEN